MQDTLDYIAQSARSLGGHPFFERVTPEPDLRRVLAFAPAAAFWVLTFQDVIALNAERTTDPLIRALVNRHAAEDRGHEEWFLQDLEQVFGALPSDPLWLFLPANRGVRAVSFALTAEVFRIGDDVLRLVLLEVLESAARVYFGHVSRVVALSGHSGRLKYFAGLHLTAEASHDMHTQSVAAQVAAIVLSSDQRIAARAMIDRMFSSFQSLGDALLQAQQRAQSPFTGPSTSTA